VRQANPQYRGGSTQGYYVLGGDGSGIVWDNYLPRLGQFLDRGLAAYRRNPPRGGAFPLEMVRVASPQSPPPGTSILRLYTRIRPLPPGAGPMNEMLGRDYMWILPDEVREIISASNKGTQPFPMPRTLVARLVVFHLVDNVRGQVWPYHARSVTRADFTARALRTTGSIRSFSLAGSFAKQDAHPPQWTSRGQEGSVEGEFEVDTGKNAIVRFRALADCRAWSDAIYDRVAPPPSGRYPIMTAMVEASDDLARRIPPEQAAAGDYYLRPQLQVR
jgi:hypothetical protein